MNVPLGIFIDYQTALMLLTILCLWNSDIILSFYGFHLDHILPLTQTTWWWQVVIYSCAYYFVFTLLNLLKVHNIHTTQLAIFKFKIKICFYRPTFRYTFVCFNVQSHHFCSKTSLLTQGMHHCEAKKIWNALPRP